MSNNPVTNRVANNLTLMIVIGLIVQLLVVGYVFYSNYQGRVNTVAAQHDGCELVKLDRAANADFQRAHADYITKVTRAASVKEDVKRAARKAVKVFRRTSRSLWKRAQIDCAAVYPNPKLFP